MGRKSSSTNPEYQADKCLGVNGETGVSRGACVDAGDSIVFEWRDWPDASQPGSIDPSHKGPCAVYMKKVDNSAASNNAAGDGWFKVMEDGYDSSAGKWCTEKLIPNDGHLAATIPKDLAAGYYLVRPELLALHQADKTPADPQFYVGCAQIFLSSSGSAVPHNTVSIPGYVSMSTPAMTFNIWAQPMKLPFPDFGPPVYTAGSTKRNLQTRAITQTIGLKPDGCMMENVNWCGFMPSLYSDQTGCYAVGVPVYPVHEKLVIADFTRHPRIVQPRLRNATILPDPQVARIASIGKASAHRSATTAAQVNTMDRPQLLASCPHPYRNSTWQRSLLQVAPWLLLIQHQQGHPPLPQRSLTILQLLLRLLP